MRSAFLAAIGFGLFASAACQEDKKQERRVIRGKWEGPKMERVHILVDEETIATKDSFAILEPVKWTGKTSGSYKDYESSLERFSRRQRLLFAVDWYATEVNNGGHDQFYSNPTGIVWEDAQKGLAEIGAFEAEEILKESVKRMGGRPPFYREERNRILDERKPSFDDLDRRFFKLELEKKMIDYIRAHPKDFVFDGEIERAVIR